MPKTWPNKYQNIFKYSNICAHHLFTIVFGLLPLSICSFGGGLVKVVLKDVVGVAITTSTITANNNYHNQPYHNFNHHNQPLPTGKENIRTDIHKLIHGTKKIATTTATTTTTIITPSTTTTFFTTTAKTTDQFRPRPSFQHNKLPQPTAHSVYIFYFVSVRTFF